MASPHKGNVSTGGGQSNNGNMPNPQKPDDISLIDTDIEKDKKYKEEINRKKEIKSKFVKFSKANLEFNSADKKMGKDSNVSLKDLYDDYGQYLPETDKRRLETLLSTEFPKFQLNKEDSVHQFWLNKRVSNGYG
jgi:hypothetical protein